MDVSKISVNTLLLWKPKDLEGKQYDFEVNFKRNLGRVAEVEVVTIDQTYPFADAYYVGKRIGVPIENLYSLAKEAN